MNSSVVVRLPVRHAELHVLLDLLERARDAIARGNDVMGNARVLLTALRSIHDELASAAVAFADGLDEDEDAEQWVYFAVSARAALDRAEKSGARALGRELEMLDESFDHLREAVLLLEPEDYKEALAATPPNPDRWWGERARLDAGLREIELERVLSVL